MSIALGLSLLVAALPAYALQPQVAGGFYPADAAELGRTVDSLLASASTAPAPGRIVGLLAPHAGYSYSGATAAAAFRLLKGTHWDTVVVVGTGHHVPIQGAATLASGALRTPLGEVAVDAKAVRRLAELSPLVKEQPEAFAGEHSVEVELPFLQRALGRFQVVPLLMNSDDPEVARQLGAALAALLRAPRTLLVVSSDLSHYPDRDTARTADAASLAALTEAPEDPAFFRRTNRLLLQRAGHGLVTTECGEAAVLAAAHAMKALKAAPRLLRYTNSGEGEGGDPSRVVGYAALAWTSAPPPARPALSAAQRRELLRLARSALSAFLERGEEPKPALWSEPEFNLPAALFVTLRRKSARREAGLRGCIGTLAPAYPLAEAVQQYALESALHDPRFRPVEAGELASLSIEVSRLAPARSVPSYREVKPGQGVTLRQEGRSGIFLPQVWEDLPDKTRFLEELCSQKAGLPRDCYKDPKTKFEVFDAEVFEEE